MNDGEISEIKKTLIPEVVSDFYNNYIKYFSDPYFENYLIYYTLNIITNQLNISKTNYELCEDIVELIEDYVLEYENTIIPKRSYFEEEVDKKYNMDRQITKKTIKWLQNVKQPEQRTPEWYTMRNGLFTASNIWKVFGSESERNQIIYEKCNIGERKNYSSFNTNTPMHHGVKYEPVSVQIYEHRNRTTVGEFGCIRHRIHKFIGASPDGINIDESSDLYGRMLEIKNIYNREITGIPKKEYWIQMQMQMETCDLEECDFLETRFIEYEGGYNEFHSDGTFNRSECGCLKGIVMYFVKDGAPYYVYPPIDISREEFDIWESEQMELYKDCMWVKNLYWRLDEYSCVLVVRNYMWFNSIIDDLSNTWEIIVKERESGFEHRAPKKRTNKKETSKSAYSEPKLNGCVINIKNLTDNADKDNVDIAEEKSDMISAEIDNTSEDITTVKKERTISIETEPISDATI
tara:strand:+ start:78 stop:1466 length:1389 start_codon:yes stop_codon:yes gene_type:complete